MGIQSLVTYHRYAAGAFFRQDTMLLQQTVSLSAAFAGSTGIITCEDELWREFS
jgi:hypothetical protein